VGWSKYALLAAAALTSAGISYGLVHWLRSFALKRGIVDLPGGRKIHRGPVPLLGGVGIVGSVLLGLVAALVALHLLGGIPSVASHFPSYPDWRSRLQAASPKLIGLLVGALLIFALGLIDDLRKGHLDYRSKFPPQFLAASVAVASGIRTQLMPGELLDVVVSLLWIVGITNAFNLIDNMDGQAAGVAAISGLALSILTISQNQDYVAFSLALLVGACAGFLPHNLHPAKIFMGDAGSLTIGFLLGCSTIQASYIDVKSPTFVPVIAPVLVFSVPIFDCASVLYIRWREGRPLFVGDRRHFSHRLVDFGMSEKEAVFFIYLVEASVAMGALLLPRLTWAGCLVVFVQTAVLYGLLTILMTVRKNREGNSKESQAGR